MRTIRLAFTDLADLPGWHRDAGDAGQISPESPDYRLLQWLRARYDVQLTTESPDYVIYSVFGHKHLSYPDAVRIFVTGENVRPDFNVCDYAFGFDYLSLGDRHCRLPHYLLYDEFDELCRRRRTEESGEMDFARREFCNFVYSNREGAPARDELFHAISAYRKVDSAGAHLNNTGRTIGKAYHGSWAAAKVAFQRQYKFTIACENSSTPGYTTEKLVHALAADTIPIYWGNPRIGREFNTGRFINCHEFPSVAAVCERIRQLDQDDRLYRDVLKQPFFPDDRPADDTSAQHALAHFDHIFSQPKRDAYRRNFHVWGKRYEAELSRAFSSAEFLGARGPLARAARLLFKAWLLRYKVRGIRGANATGSVPARPLRNTEADAELVSYAANPADAKWRSAK